MSCSTKRHHTKCPARGSSAAANASTAGSASPSLSPDSRFSEWRIDLGTRGSVTTPEDSTGSVGESSAPSRKRLGPAQARSSRARAARRSMRGDRHRDRELAQRQLPVALQQLAVHLEAVAEQDHDQRDRREVVDEAGARLEVQDAERRLRRAGSRRARTRAVSESMLRRARPDSSAPDHQQPAEDRRRRLEGGHCGSVPQAPQWQTRRGHLKVFIGMAPGVGKTYRMLQEGGAEADSGRDVVIGYLEPHGRAETVAQAEGLEIVPRRAAGLSRHARWRRWTCRRSSRAHRSCA